jgi:hypothetical protein
MKRLIARWRRYRQHKRNMARFFALFEQESVALHDCMIGLAEVYADAQRMAAENEQEAIR